MLVTVALYMVLPVSVSYLRKQHLSLFLQLRPLRIVQLFHDSKMRKMQKLD